MNTTVKKLYQQQRKNGSSAINALRSAKVLQQWEALEDNGFVRIELVPDESPDLSWLGKYSDRWEAGAIDRKAAGDWERNQYRYFIPTNPPYARSDYKQMCRADRDGMWIVSGQYRTSPDGEWEWGDSVGGYVGDDANDQTNQIDIMAGTLEALRTALRSRCPLCGKGGYVQHVETS